MKKKYLLIIGFISLAVVLLATAYNSPNIQNRLLHLTASMRSASGGSTTGSGSLGLSGEPRTFEDLVTSATHVVVAEYVGRRSFGRAFTEFEFIVHEQVIGDTADTIFVYTEDARVMDGFSSVDLQFTTGTQYLLVLWEIADVYSRFDDYGLRFVRDIILDLNDPARSTMNNEPLSLHSRLNFNRNLTRERILSHVRSLPRDPFRPRSMFITSENLEDIINGSPYVLVIEINEPRRLGGEGIYADVGSTDIYYITIVEVLKGNMQVGDELRIVFYADTVFTGETHLVSIWHNDLHALTPFFHTFTSRNSLHCMEQRDEIMAIIRGPSRPGTSSSATPTPSPTPEPSPTPTPTPTPVPAGPSRFSASPYNPDDATDIQLINIEIDLPEDFVSAVLEIDELNAMFLLEEMHSIAVAADDITSIIGVYVGDLELTDVQLLMFRGFTIDPDTGDYTVIAGSFSADRDYFYFEFAGSGTIGAMIYELPTPLLRLTINQYRYYYRGAQQTSDAAPFITQNRTMVPIRLVSEALGATPRWDRSNRTAYIYYNDTVLRLPVGEPLPDEMGTPLLRNNRILVPLRFVIENFDAFTFWDRDTREVTVFVLD
ncbi:MAG: copper amine oxidase N-terminal domain-containing protein [Defluviitaleaceae bacterium]|nr:copper amine oxidase N-terminal domain-containing protein [Defluviitaleaceae bacterium]